MPRLVIEIHVDTAGRYDWRPHVWVDNFSYIEGKGRRTLHMCWLCVSVTANVVRKGNPAC